MTKHVGSFSSLRGPTGRMLADYVVENLPDLWNLIVEPITGVTNTGAQYVGTVEDLFLFDDPDFSLPVVIPTDKSFWFTPHVVNLTGAQLSLSDNRGHASPFYPILRGSDGIAITANDLLTTRRYLLRFTGSAFSIVGNSIEIDNILDQLSDHETRIDTLEGSLGAGFTKNTEAEARAGVEDTKGSTALKTKYAIESLGMLRYATLSAMQAVAVRSGEARFLAGRDSVGDPAAGIFIGSSADLSSLCIGTSVASSAVTSATDTMTCVATDLDDAMVAVVSATINGLTANTPLLHQENQQNHH